MALSTYFYHRCQPSATKPLLQVTMLLLNLADALTAMYVATTITLAHNNNHQPPIISRLLLSSAAMILFFHCHGVLLSSLQSSSLLQCTTLVVVMISPKPTLWWLMMAAPLLSRFLRRRKLQVILFHSITSRHSLLSTCLKLINANLSLKNARTGWGDPGGSQTKHLGA